MPSASTEQLRYHVIPVGSVCFPARPSTGSEPAANAPGRAAPRAASYLLRRRSRCVSSEVTACVPVGGGAPPSTAKADTSWSR
ncbi:hypothetical protein GCM10027572_12520 [Flexivirga lutea]